MGANVFLVEVALDKPTDMGSASDLDGNYMITEIPSGRYFLVSFYIGYESYRQLIRIRPDDKDYVINIELSATRLVEIRYCSFSREFYDAKDSVQCHQSADHDNIFDIIICSRREFNEKSVPGSH